MDTRTSIDLVVVTGGTGHVGAMVVHQLLKGGYRVRATARPAKVDMLKDTHPDANGRLEVVEMNDLVDDAGKWPDILQGVDAVIHVAAPVYHPSTTSEYIYVSANVGTQKLLDAVGQSSVKRFILTSSLGVFFNPDFSSLFDQVVYDHNTWSPLEDFDPKGHDPSYAYIASKITSEKLVWKAANRYPQIDFTTILPSTVYGWFLKNYPVPKSVSEFNANKFLYQLIEKGVTFPEYPLTDLVHNRDVAKAHVLALTAPVLPKGQRKRFIVSQGNMTWVQGIAFLEEPATVEKFRARGHDILSRLPDVSRAGMQSQFKVDRTLTESVLGMKQEDYVPWQEILLEVVPAMMDWEQSHSDLVC